jgi:hypothetical protein
MSLSRFRSPTELVVVAALAAGCGGGSDDRCGPDDAPAVGLVAAGEGVTLTYGALTGGLNGDCPAAGAPSGVTSLTIAGTGDGGFVTLCVSRPDLLAKQAQALALEVPGTTVEVGIVDVAGTAAGCSYAIDRAKPATGSATSTGLCDNGADAAGFALELDGALSLTRTCGQTVDSVAVTLRGRVAVAKQ